MAVDCQGPRQELIDKLAQRVYVSCSFGPSWILCELWRISGGPSVLSKAQRRELATDGRSLSRWCVRRRIPPSTEHRDRAVKGLVLLPFMSCEQTRDIPASRYVAQSIPTAYQANLHRCGQTVSLSQYIVRISILNRV